MSPAAGLLRALTHGYRLLVRPVLAPACRFTPSCSQYALEALDRHGAVAGTGLILRRLARCQPWGGFGYDPVPGDPAAARRGFGAGTGAATRR